MLIAKTLSMVVLAAIAWEDLRYRAIHWFLLVGLVLCLVVPALRERPLVEWGADTGYNLAFLVVQTTLALGLLMIRQGRWENPLSRWIGLGDLLFMVVLAAGLSRWNFLIFYLSGLVLCLPTFLLMRWLAPRSAPSIPLAGLLAIYLGLWMAMHLSGHAPAFYAGDIGPDIISHG